MSARRAAGGLRADPAGQSAVRSLRSRVTQPASRATRRDGALPSARERAAVPGRRQLDAGDVPAAARGRPAVAVATAEVVRGVVRGRQGGHHAAGRKDLLFYDLKTQLGGFQDVLIRAVLAEFVRLGTPRRRGRRSAPARRWRWRRRGQRRRRARTALHLLCSSDTLPPPVFLECLEVCLHGGGPRRGLDAFAGDQPDALPRFVTTDPPLVNPTETQNLMEATFPGLLSAIPAAARVTDSGGWSIAHNLLRRTRHAA